MKDGSALDENFFSKEVNPSNPLLQSFTVNYIEDRNATGVYDISFAIFFVDFPDLRVEVLDAFQITIEDPCTFAVMPNWCKDDLDSGV